MVGSSERDSTLGSLVENAIHFAEQGKKAQALGILAGLSPAEQEVWGPIILDSLPKKRRLALPDPYGNAALATATKTIESAEARVPEPGPGATGRHR